MTTGGPGPRGNAAGGRVGPFSAPPAPATTVDALPCDAPGCVAPGTGGRLTYEDPGGRFVVHRRTCVAHLEDVVIEVNRAVVLMRVAVEGGRVARRPGADRA